MKDENAPVHQLDHAEPTVIHHPEEDMTILARWLQHGMEQRARFWLILGGAVIVLVAIAVISSGLSASKSAGSGAWTELTQAKTAEDRIKIAEAHPSTPVAGWARLMAAEEEYEKGVDDLTTPGKKELAGPRLKKALDLFQQVAKDAEKEKDSSQALGGLFGTARTLEARNELPEAIAQYKLVAERFPDSPEAKQSMAMARALEDPQNQMFYKELYAYQPPSIPTATPGLGGLDGPGSLLAPPPSFLPGPSSKSALPTTPAPAGLDAPPPTTPPSPALESPKVEAPKKEETPKPADTPKPAEAPKSAEAPAPPK